MTQHNSFFREGQPAAVFKHKLLTDYLTAWAAKLGSFNSGGVTFLDGYAGAGQYDDGGHGSPLIAMRIARKFRTFQNPVDLQCIFVEKVPETAEKLQAVIAREGNGMNVVGPLLGDLSDNLETVLTHAGSRPLLAFLDPFGTSLPADTLLDQLMKRPNGAQTEVLLNFSIESVWRLGGLMQADPQFVRAGTRAAVERADTFLGGKWWHEPFVKARGEAEAKDSLGAAADAAAAVARQFSEEICQRSDYEVLSVPVRKAPDRKPFFSLMLFHSSAAAKLPFVDAAARAHKVWRSDYWERYADQVNAGDVLFKLDASDQHSEEEARIRDRCRVTLETNLRNLLRQSSLVSIASNVERIFGITLGTASEADLRAVWKALHKCGLIENSPVGMKRLSRATIIRQRNAL